MAASISSSCSNYRYLVPFVAGATITLLNGFPSSLAFRFIQAGIGTRLMGMAFGDASRIVRQIRQEDTDSQSLLNFGKRCLDLAGNAFIVTGFYYLYYS